VNKSFDAFVKNRLAAISCAMGLNLYQFPATRFVSNTLWRQWWHMLSEVVEVGKALLCGDLQHAATETWDVKQSSETMHRILAGKGADIELAQDEIINNNWERGYY
jgi:hypothetical protein